jgi:hypothetical protein
MKRSSLGDLGVTKQNKLPCFIARWVCQGGLQCFFELRRQRNIKEKKTKRITKSLKKKSLDHPSLSNSYLVHFLYVSND